MVDPATAFVTYGMAAAIATARPRWDVVSPSNLESVVCDTARTYPKANFQSPTHLTMNDALQRELNRYSALADGWDGEGSRRADPLVVGLAGRIIEQMREGLKPSPMLAHDGTLGLYWDTELAYAELEFTSAESVSLYLRNRINASDERYLEEQPVETLTPEWLTDFLAPLLGESFESSITLAA